ncbi:MAG: hypothetical protein AAFR49_10715 [Pseudomonadota bacterium]
MAKKTTAGKGPSRRKKSTKNIEDAEVVDAASSTAEKQPKTVDTGARDALSSETPEDTATAATDASELAVDTSSDTESVPSAAAESGTEKDEPETDADAPVSGESPPDETSVAVHDDANEPSTDPEDATEDKTTDTALTDQDASEEQAASETEDSASEDTGSLSEPVEEPASTAPPPHEPEPKKASAFPLVFGGLLAGAIGFGAAYLTDGINPPPVPEPVDLSGLEQSIEAQGQRLDEVAASIPEVSAPTIDTSELEASIASVVDSVIALEARIAALESRPAGEDSALGAVDPAVVEDLNALKATVDELDALRSTVAALQEANVAAEDAARSEAAAALQRAAMTRVQTALDTGAPFADTLSELQALGLEVPDPLSASAADGVPTLVSLQDAFPEAARAALAADRAEASANGETGGVVDFFRSQLGARSLTPQEGDSSDAVLSRVEHAVREGRLADALAEIETLPDVSQPAMADWSTIASARADALSAAQALMDSLN